MPSLVIVEGRGLSISIGSIGSVWGATLHALESYWFVAVIAVLWAIISYPLIISHGGDEERRSGRRLQPVLVAGMKLVVLCAVGALLRMLTSAQDKLTVREAITRFLLYTVSNVILGGIAIVILVLALRTWHVVLPMRYKRREGRHSDG